MNTSPIDVVELAREIACRLAPEALLDPEDAGAILGCTARYVTEHYALAAGFPKAIRLRGPGSTKSKPKYRRSAIMAWIESHEVRAGRARIN